MVAYSCFRRNTMKWWKKVFFHLFSLSILNASILYKQRTQSPGCKFRRNTMKWWKKVFFHLFSLSILNASILYKQRTQSPGCKGPFKRSLLRTLASPILSLREATQGGQPKAPPIFKLEVTSQRKYWAPGRSPTSPRHVGFAFLSKRRF